MIWPSKWRHLKGLSDLMALASCRRDDPRHYSTSPLFATEPLNLFATTDATRSGYPSGQATRLALVVTERGVLGPPDALLLVLFRSLLADALEFLPEIVKLLPEPAGRCDHHQCL